MASPLVVVPPPSDEVAAELKSKHGEVHALELCGRTEPDDKPRVTFVVRLPTRIEFKRFKDASMNRSADVQLKASEQLARACIVYPAPEVIEATVEKYVGVLETTAGEVLELAGIEKSPAKKAL